MTQENKIDHPADFDSEIEIRLRDEFRKQLIGVSKVVFARIQ